MSETGRGVSNLFYVVVFVQELQLAYEHTNTQHLSPRLHLPPYLELD